MSGQRLRVLVAGAGGGIGAACVARLRAAGHDVVGLDRDDGVDIAVAGGAEAAVETAEARLGGLDGLVHAVGMSGRRLGDGPVSDCTDEAWSEVLRVNLTSALWLLRAGLPALRRAGGGAAVLVGSVLAEATDADFLTAAYATSKAGLVALSRAAAREGAAEDIRVNVVAAGLVATPMAERAAHDPHVQSRLADLQPLGAAMLDPDDVAAAVAWLLSPDAARVTGTTLPVDAGWLL